MGDGISDLPQRGEGWASDAQRGEYEARIACWRKCKKGEHPWQTGENFTRCCDPRVCHGWRAEMEAGG